MKEIVRFELSKVQVDFLRDKYLDVPLIKKVLDKSDGLVFNVPEDEFVEFFGWLEDESVQTMTEDYDPTEDTLVIESMIDDILDR